MSRDSVPTRQNAEQEATLRMHVATFISDSGSMLRVNRFTSTLISSLLRTSTRTRSRSSSSPLISLASWERSTWLFSLPPYSSYASFTLTDRTLLLGVFLKPSVEVKKK